MWRLGTTKTCFQDDIGVGDKNTIGHILRQFTSSADNHRQPGRPIYRHPGKPMAHGPNLGGGNYKLKNIVKYREFT